MLRTLTGALALGLGTAAALAAQPAYRVKDIATRPSYGSDPRGFVTVEGVTYFAANDPAHGEELWRTDGTPAGTRIVKDTTPGPSGSIDGMPVAFRGDAWFVSGAALWRTNGTTAGTVRVRPLGLAVTDLAVLADHLYFVAKDDLGVELWRTDGTDAGTARVADIAPGPASSYPYEFVSAGGLLYFGASGAGGEELWRTDGTAAGTLQVFDVRPGPQGSAPFSLVASGTHVFFVADDGVHGRELWSVGLDTNVTALVRDIQAGALGSSLSNLTAHGGGVFFGATDGVSGVEPWTSDGTTAGTRLVSDIQTGSGGSYPERLTSVGSTLFFTLEHTNGRQLWRTDGSTAGTQRVDGTTALVQPRDLAAHDGALFFSADTPASGREVWRTDGTEAGTTLIDLRPGAEGSNPRHLSSAGGRLYFAAALPGVPFSVLGEPWVSDGTAEGSALLRVINGADSSDAFGGGDLGGVLVFAADDGVHGTELWRSDGTDAGTSLVADLRPGTESSFPWSFTAYAGVQYFLLVGAESGLWRTDGTAAGTVRVSAPGLFTGYELVRSGPYLYFAGYDDVYGSELWRSDGTAAGTVPVKDMTPGPEGEVPEWLTDVNGALFFRGADPAEGYALWKTDGTEAGTVRVDPVLPGPDPADLRDLRAVGSRLFFVADDGLHGLEPWVSDGTNAGTLQVRDVRPGPEGSFARFVTAAGALAFFSAADGTTGFEPWRSDGTEAGTFRLADVSPGPAGSDPTAMTAVANGVVFGADDGIEGHELWRSDGTVAGTLRVRAIAPGAESSLVQTQSLGSWGGWAYFAAADAEHGQELWRSDGTAAGTTLVQDLRPGPMSSAPQVLSAAGGRLFLTAVDDTGNELWLLRPELSVANAAADEGAHALVRVTLVPRPDAALAVPFTTVDNSAVAGTDFQAASGTLTFAPGETLRTIDVAVLDDTTTETVEQFFIDVAPDERAYAAPARGIVTVTDDDVAPALSIGDASVVEGDAGTVTASFTVTLAPAGAVTVTVPYTTVGATAGAFDFDATAGTLTFPPGMTTRTVDVPVRGDVVDEPNEFFFVRLGSPAGGVVAVGEGVGRIADDDGAERRVRPLDSGATLTASLAGAPSPDAHLYLVELRPGESYELTVDAASGDLGDQGPLVQRVDGALNVVQDSRPLGVGHARALRLLNAQLDRMYAYVRVSSAQCTTDCGADDTYRLRLRETTARAARFNENGQRTVLVLQNRGDEPLLVNAQYWSGDGVFLANVFPTIPAFGSLLVPTPAAAAGQSGSITVLHAGAHGQLAGKAVSFDEATGLTFDTPLVTRPR